ncbi:glycosyltransferase [Sphingomonas sp. HF-S3]|uniref:Glycosyltransferase n=1 Tax=Sphingomonas rustica TaxID=3103142 RepID=A0ABV0B918_9SPHN
MNKISEVSVVCANYNNAPYLDDFFTAFEVSTLSPKELIFVDDGSTDDSLVIARRFAGRLPYLEIVPLECNQGFGNALNAGIERATGQFIMRIDPDDIMLPDRIEVQHELLASGRCDVVGSNAEIFHSDTGKVLGTTNFPLTHDEIDAKIRAGEHGVLHPTVMGLTKFFKSEPYVQAHVPAEDYDVFARMLVAGARFANVDRVLTRYRVHQKSASNILPFSTIETTFMLRDNIFNTRTPRWRVIAYFVHIKFYRRYLFANEPMRRMIFLCISTLFYPSKLWSRLHRGLIRSANRQSGPA